MSPVVFPLVVLLGAAPAAGEFKAFLAHVSARPLPFKVAAVAGTKGEHRLTRKEYQARLFDPVAAFEDRQNVKPLRLPAPSEISEGAAPDSPGTTVTMLGKVVRPYYTGVLYGVSVNAEVASFFTLHYVTYDNEGWVLGALKVGEDSGMYGAESSSVAAFEKDGSVVTTYTATIDLESVAAVLPGGLKMVHQTKVAAIGGGFDSPEESSTLSGRFVDDKSQESLLISQSGAEVKVFYAAKAASSPYLPMKVVAKALAAKPATLTARFAKSPGNYLLTFDDSGRSVTCQNPDGSVQTFAR